MSDSNSKPQINITRGSKGRSSKNKETSSDASQTSLPSAFDVAGGLAEAGRNVWLAGLGALSMAEEAGSQVFGTLVEEGKTWERTRRETAEQTTKRLQEVADQGQQVAADAATSVEDRIRSEVDGVLQRVGVPRNEDLDALRTQVSDLSEKIDRLSKALDDKNGQEA